MTTREDALAEELRALIRAAEQYLDKPGCNPSSRRMAHAKMRWAIDKARKAVEDE